MKSCSEEGCHKNIIARGLCTNHYAKWRYANDPDYREKTKERNLARRARPGEKERERARSKHRYDNDEAYRETLRKRHASRYERPEVRHKARDNALRKKGFTSALFDLLLERQSGACAICARAVERTRRVHNSAYADHCHETGKARGVLCMICNTSLGLYEKHLRGTKVSVPVFDAYLADWPTSSLSPQHAERH